jgi:hypothetical protein
MASLPGTHPLMKEGYVTMYFFYNPAFYATAAQSNHFKAFNSTFATPLPAIMVPNRL